MGNDTQTTQKNIKFIRQAKLLQWVTPLFLLMVFILYTILFLHLFKDKNAASPDTTINLLLSKMFSEEYRLSYKESLNYKYDTFIFGHRGFAYNEQTDQMVHVSMHGYPTYLGYLEFIHPVLIYASNAFFVAAGTYFLFKLTYLFFNNKVTSLVVSIFYVLSPTLLYNSNILLNNVLNTALFFAAYYYLIRGLKDQSIRLVSLGYIIALVSIWIRYDTILFYLPLLFIFLRKDNKQKLLQIVSATIFSILVLYPLYIVNNSMYGTLLGFTKPGLRLSAFPEISNVAQTPLQSLLSLIFNLNVIDIPANLFKYFFLVSPVVVVGAITGFIMKRSEQDQFKKTLITIMALASMLWLIFYYRGKWSGWQYEEVSVATGYSRYVLAVWGLVTILFMYAIEQVKSVSAKRILIISLFITHIISGMGLAANGLYGLAFYEEQQENINEYKHKIRQTEGSTIIFARAADKYIYPLRKTAMYEAIDPDTRVDETCRVVNELIQDDVPVYFTTENSYEDPLVRYFTKLREYGLKATLNKELLLWKIEKE